MEVLRRETRVLARTVASSRSAAILPWLAAAAVLCAYFAGRLQGLLALPMFIDEGTYLTWALRALHAERPLDALVSVTDGKQPLFPWLIVPFLLVVTERLEAARLVSVGAGAVALGALYALMSRLYGRASAVVAVALYLVAPLTFFYDRLALYDPLMAAQALVLLAVSFWWSERPTVGRTVVLGATMGTAMLTKISAAAFVLPAPALPLLVYPARWRTWWRAAGAYALAAAVFGVFLLHPSAGVLGQGTTDRYAFTPAELLALPLHTWRMNALDIAAHLAAYLPAPLWPLAAAGLLLPLLTRDRRDLAIATWALLLLGGVFAVSKVAYFRYYVPGAVALLLPAARMIWLVAEWVGRALASLPLKGGAARRQSQPAGSAVVAAALVGAVAVPSLAFNVALATDPLAAPLPDGLRSDREQYVRGMNAGWKTDALVAFLAAEAERGPIIIAVNAQTGQMRSWVEGGLAYRPNVHVLLRDGSSLPAEQVLSLSEDDPVRRLALGEGRLFLAVSEWSSSPAAQPFREDNPGARARLVADFPRTGMDWRHRVYEVEVPRPPAPVSPVTFGDGIHLAAFMAAPDAGGDVEAVTLRIHWRTERPPPRFSTVFVHLVSESSDAEKVSQHDGPPPSRRNDASDWRPGEIIEDSRRLELPRDTTCGAYRVLVGWYDAQTQQRLTARTDAYPVRNDAVQLATVRVGRCAEAGEPGSA